MTQPISHLFSGHVPTDAQTTWDAFSDTERFSRLAGIDMRFAYVAAADGGTERHGQMQHLGLTLTWVETPVVFDAPRHYVIQRAYIGGPARTYESELRVTPTASGCDVALAFRYTPRSPLLRGAVALDAAFVVKPQLKRAFLALLTALQEGRPVPDAPAPPLTHAARQTVTAALLRVTPAVAAPLGQLLQTAPLADQVRLRPLDLARQWNLTPEVATVGLLEAAQAGLLKPQWEVICPSCRLPSQTVPTFSLANRQQHCEGCDIRYDISFAESVALTLQPTPAVRALAVKVDCLSSPARMVHIVAQTVLAPRVDFDWQLSLPPGRYRLRTLPERDQATLVVRPDLARSEATLLAGRRALTPPSLRLGAGEVTLRVRSKDDAPLTLLLEHADVDPDTLTIGRVLEWPAAAQHLPAEALEPGLAVGTWRGPLLAVHIARGGAAGERAVADAVRDAGARSVQQSTGWVLATLPDWATLARIAPHLADALWLQSAVGFGTVLELVSGDVRVASGARLHDLVALAQDAEPGQIRVLDPSADLQVPGWQVSDSTHELRTALRCSPLPLPTRATHALTTGDAVDERFLLGDLLGRGGFGLVYAARDQAMETDVVVKLLRHELAADTTQVQRFFDEGRIAARLTGPHAVRVHEWGLAEDGRLFLAMERLDGMELGDLLRATGTLDPARAMRLCVQAARGLAEAHGHGLVHRDIKPANLFVLHADDLGRELVKVIDYGIALEQTRRGRTAEVPGTLIGTPLYMAPEQVTGERLDGRCDLYALALVLYQTLSGRLPFSGPDVMALLMARLVQTPPLVSDIARQPLPTGLAQWLAGALAQLPQQRPRDAETWAAELEAQLPSESEQASWSASWQASRGPVSDLAQQETVDALAVTMDTALLDTALADTEPGPPA